MTKLTDARKVRKRNCCVMQSVRKKKVKGEDGGGSGVPDIQSFLYGPGFIVEQRTDQE